MTPSPTLRVLIVDDEKSIRRFLKTALASREFTVFEVENGTDALRMAVTCRPDLIILDLGLPDIEGFEVAREIRKRSSTPIIILSVRDREEDKIRALDAGADDYLTKPFGVGELLARIRAVMRRLVQNETQEFRSGKLCVNIAKHSAELNGKALALSPTEYEILKLLVLNAGAVVKQSQFLKEIWNKNEDVEGASHLLRVTISHLRNKIEPNPDNPMYVLTEPGVGYRLKSED